ncbi:hypothetical protein HUU05_10565, partial [candidate division KSB1 bacterium]|nr:hypothetical protein [candidate division KSB1 bacterium]
MKGKILPSAVVLLAVLSWTHLRALENTSAKSMPADSNSYEAVYEQLMILGRTASRMASVEHVILQRDEGKFLLTQGELYLFSPEQNRIGGALFRGKGAFTMTPPTAIEQDQLYRFYETKTLSKEFDLLFLLFADTTRQELEKKLNFTAPQNNRTVQDEVKSCLSFVSNKKGK